MNLEKVSVVGTSGGALVAINLCLEHAERIKYLIADSFEGEYPLPSYINTIKADREKDKKKLLAKLIWFYCHGFDWKKVVDLDTDVNIAFSQTGKSFFHKAISNLQVPTTLTGSLEDEYCKELDKIYGALKEKNNRLNIQLFKKGKHPAILSNKNEFIELIKEKIENV